MLDWVDIKRLKVDMIEKEKFNKNLIYGKLMLNKRNFYGLDIG